MKRYLRTYICLLVVTMASAAQAAYFDDVEYARLTSELGSMTPDGAEVGVAQVEADNDQDPLVLAYAPDPGHTQFIGKTLVQASGNTGYYSAHATAVGKLFFGTVGSTAPAIGNSPGPAISIYWADAWLTGGFLHAGQSELPDFSPSRITNHSWVGAYSEAAQNLEVLRRTDWLVDVEEAVQVVGFVANNPLLGSAYNVVAVTTPGRQTTSGAAPVSGDVAYAMAHVRPDIVAPGSYVSNAAPRVASGIAILLDAAHSNPSLSNGSMTNSYGDQIYNAERSEVLKAALMAGADRSTSNTTDEDITDYRVIIAHQTANGLDRRFGAGQLNIYNSFHIVAGGEQDSDQDDGGNGSGQIDVYGFDYDEAFGGQQGSNSDANYYFSVGADLVEITAALVWNIEIDPGPGLDFDRNAKLYDLDLGLYEVIDPGNFATWVLISVSNSASENTENIRDILVPGKNYALRVVRGTGQTAFKWDYGMAWQLEVVPDDDSDGIPNSSDNCIVAANGILIPDAGGNSQLDTDGDGYGNLCDGDFNQDDIVNSIDLGLFKQRFFTADPDADLNGDGAVNSLDLGLFKQQFFAPPGPSGLVP